MSPVKSGQVLVGAIFRIDNGDHCQIMPRQCHKEMRDLEFLRMFRIWREVQICPSSRKIFINTFAIETEKGLNTIKVQDGGKVYSDEISLQQKTIRSVCLCKLERCPELTPDVPRVKDKSQSQVTEKWFIHAKLLEMGEVKLL